MRILLINHYAGSVHHGMEFRPYYLAREWVKSGNEVLIVAASYSHLRRENPQFEGGLFRETVDGVPYLWVKTPRYHDNGLGRAKNILAFYTKLHAKARAIAAEFRPQAVIASSTYPFDNYLAARIAQLSGGRFYYEIHDLWPLTQLELYGLSPANPYVRMLQRAEDFAFKNASRVISVLPQADLHMAERGFSRDKFVYIPNGVVLPENAQAENQDKQQDGGKTEETLRMQKAAGKFVVLYLGGFATANALEDFVDAAGLVGEGIALVLVGDGGKKQQLIARAGGAENICFLDSVKKERVQQVLQLADCLYLGARRCELYRYGVGMNKLYDYMLAARPIICGIEASNDPVGESGCGLTIKPESPRAIADAIASLRAKTEAERRAMGERGTNYVREQHKYAILAQKFLEALD